MAEGVNPLILPIGADATQFEKSINEIKDRIKQLSSIIKSTPFNLVTQGQRDELAGLIVTLDRLNDSVAKTSDQFNKSVGSSKNARTALTSLSLVAQDLPFGFIAIQNNLPAVISSFGELTKASKGVKGALGEISKALVGPAGLFLAFSVATSALTFLIQKYGSFGGAINALFGTQSKLIDQILKANKAYKEFNEDLRTSIEITDQSIAAKNGEIASIQGLLKIVQDQTLSYNERNTALNKLKEIDKDYFYNLDLEKTKLSDLNTQVQAYIEIIKRAAVTKGFEGAIGNTSVELSKQERLLKNLKVALDDAIRAPQKIVGKAGVVDKREIIAAQEAYDAQSKVVEELKKELSGYNTEIDKSIRLQNATQVGIDATTEANKKAQEQLDKNTKSLKKNADESLKAAEAEAKRIAANLAALEKFNLELLDEKNKKNIKETQAFLKETLSNFIKLRGEFAVKPKLTFFEEIDKKFKNLPTYFSKQIPEIQNIPLIKLQAEIDLDKKKILEKAEEFKQIGSFIEDNLRRPFRDFFDEIIETGKFSFDTLNKLLKDALKRMLAQIVAAGIARLLASILVPGGAQAAVIAGAGKKKGAFEGFKNLLGFSANNPSFAGVEPSPLQLAGAVNLQLRGSDLVGSINRTNTTINRIG